MSRMQPFQRTLFSTDRDEECHNARMAEELRHQQALHDAAPSFEDGSWLPGGTWVDFGLNDKPYTEEENKALGPIVHSRIECNNCHKSPIIGVRYKCKTCLNFDLCGQCVSSLSGVQHNVDHPTHSMLKLYRSQFVYRLPDEGDTTDTKAEKEATTATENTLPTLVASASGGGAVAIASSKVQTESGWAAASATLVTPESTAVVSTTNASASVPDMDKKQTNCAYCGTTRTDLMHAHAECIRFLVIDATTVVFQTRQYFLNTKRFMRVVADGATPHIVWLSSKEGQLVMCNACDMEKDTCFTLSSTAAPTGTATLLPPWRTSTHFFRCFPDPPTIVIGSPANPIAIEPSTTNAMSQKSADGCQPRGSSSKRLLVDGINSLFQLAVHNAEDLAIAFDAVHTRAKQLGVYSLVCPAPACTHKTWLRDVKCSNCVVPLGV